MSISRIASTLLLLALGGCKIRQPIGGCLFEEMELSPESMTPWDTVAEHDMEQLVGPYQGTLTWYDGDDVITVPKAGQAVEVEAEVELDLSTIRIREYIKDPERTAACESDELLVNATMTFVRLDDGEIELTVPFTAFREAEPSQYFGEAETMPVSDFTPGLAPMMELDVEAVTTMVWWGPEGSSLLAEFSYGGQTNDSPSTGHGSFKRIAEFTMPE
jgi:hypothetical protein